MSRLFHSSMYVFVVALFLAIIGDTLLTTGLFMDGLIYSNVANNMAHGIGSFWHPSYTLTQFPEFYEHPPLAMGLLSLFYRILGDGIWVVRFYSMFMTLLTAWLLLKLWKQLGFEMRMGWLPLLMWTLVPAVTLNSHENMLECTMAVFVVEAVLLILRGGTWRMILAGVMLVAAFLTKGFTGLYPLALPLILFLTRPRDNAFTRSRAHAINVAGTNTLLLIASMAVTFGLVCLLPGAWDFISNYFKIQVVGTINEPVVSTRWWIVRKFFEETLILWALVIVGFVLELRRCKSDPMTVPHLPQLPLLLLTLCGVLPIMVSLKQRDFYILTVYSFFAVAVAAGLNDLIAKWCSKVNKLACGIVVACAVALSIFAIVFNASHYGKPGRDVALQEDMKLVVPYLQKDELVSVGQADYDHYRLHGYYWRSAHVSLTNQIGNKHLLLGDETQFKALQLDTLYSPINLPTQQYKLYELVTSNQ